MRVAAAYAQAAWQMSPRWSLAAGLRAEYVRYDYDNRMLAGNTDENGVPCGTTGCLYSRPDDRADSFDALAPKLALSFAIRLLSGARPHALRRTFLAAVILTQSRIVAV